MSHQSSAAAATQAVTVAASQPSAAAKVQPHIKKPVAPKAPSQGTLVADAQGHLDVQKGSVTNLFVFDKAQPGWPKSMRILPSESLELLQYAAPRYPHVAISGRVMVFQHRRYLFALPDIRVVGAPARHGNTGSAPVPTTAPKNPEVLLRSLLSHHISAPVELPANLHGSAMEGALLPNNIGKKQFPLLREGTYIWNQNGRLTFDPVTHEWTFVFTAPNLQRHAPSIMLLPCHFLQMMITDQKTKGTNINFRISGQVTYYQGRNYLLLTYVQVQHNFSRF
ncbi:MAG: hypothetical protein HKL96_10070 [Phycisphaerales bacterium]|nr:hypothetical protein [Phycisphaerales bacterium]